LTRFHFDYASGESYEMDDAGQDLPNLEAARQHAVHLASGYMRSCEAGAPDWVGWSVEVVDEYGRLALSLPFRSALRTWDSAQRDRARAQVLGFEHERRPDGG
jgi:hypothetical protein